MQLNIDDSAPVTRKVFLFIVSVFHLQPSHLILLAICSDYLEF